MNIIFELVFHATKPMLDVKFGAFMLANPESVNKSLHIFLMHNAIHHVSRADEMIVFCLMLIHAFCWNSTFL